ncbi:unnamed protein product [Calypogeia fissa]
MFRPLQSPMLLLLLLTISTSVSSLSHASSPYLRLPIHVFHEFPTTIWIENLAVRSNGDILLTLLTSPDLYLISASDKSAKVLHTFAAASSLTGIAELDDDIFYIAASNCSHVTFGSMPESYSVWEVDMGSFANSGAATITKVRDMPETFIPNGMAALSKIDNTILIADSIPGSVWKLNVKTGAYSIAFADPTTATDSKSKSIGIAINGIQIRDGYLYYTNTNKGLLCRVPISESGTATGDVEVLATGLLPDDFALDCEGRVWIAQNVANVVSVLLADGTLVDVVSATDFQFIIAGPTSCAFGRHKGGEEKGIRAMEARGDDLGMVGKWDMVLYCVTSKGQIVVLGGGTEERSDSAQE